MNKLVLLPSAKLVSLELQNEFGRIPSAMIPLDSRPALHYISDYYQKRGFNLLLAVHENAEEVHRYCNDHPDIFASIVDVEDTRSLGETICRALGNLTTLPDFLVINFADTCIGDELMTGNVVCFSEQEDYFRWTTFQLNSDLSFKNISEKWTEKKSGKEKLYVFVGVFGILDVGLFYELLKQEVTNNTNNEVDPFYLAIKNYYDIFDDTRKNFQRINDWWDFGHLDTYYSTKKQISLNCRFFNRVTVDSRRGIIHKTSKNTKKLLNEIKWYLKLPKALQYLAPRVFDYSLAFQDPYIDLEFYGYPALNDMYIFGDYDIGVWSQIFSAIEGVTSDMGMYRLVPQERKDLLDAMQYMYVTKTISRLTNIIEDERFAPFCSETVTINGKKVLGLKKALDSLPDLIKKVDLYDQQWFSIIHGDLCLSNILYDNRNRIVRFIDPRGGFGKYDIYGDPRYDIAKLSHSIEGDYDFLVNGLFDLEWRGSEIFFQVHLQERHQEIKKLFKKKILEKWNVNYLQMKLIESLLFLSMVPLHADRFFSQQAFLARGLEAINNVANNDVGKDVDSVW